MSGVISVCFTVGVMGVMTLTSVASPASVAPHEKRQQSRRKKPDTRARVTRSMIVEAQQRLTELGYWIAGTNGKWNEASRQGLVAFQKVEGRPRTGKLTPAELQALNAASRPLPREKGFAHIEVDLKRQVLFVVNADGTVSKTLPVSTGNGKMFELEGDTLPAVTPPGRFHVYSKLPGWRKSPLGLLYYPNYILGGIAIHGNPEVPAQPASHGCIRIPMFAATEFSAITPIGTQVIVYAATP
jgi:L,D-transpeptidase catalytic domain/Putative peptidoglycan binding domain